MSKDAHRRPLPQRLCSYLQDLDGFGTDEFAVQMLISDIATVLRHMIFLCQGTDGKRYTFHDPVVTEITESDRLINTGDVRHLIADDDGLAEQLFCGRAPQDVSVIIL